MPVSLKAMEYFTSALRHGNIAKAAAELNIAASAVSAAIDQVEDAFDLKLVTRQRSRGIRANASGLAVARKCERLLEDYRSLMSDGAALKQSLSGSLRIGYYAPVSPAFLPKVVKSFLSDATHVRLYLDECDNDAAQEGLLNGAYDAILFVSMNARPAIEFDVLIEARPYCLLPADHALARQETVAMADIAKEPLVVLNRPVVATYYRELLDDHAGDVNIAAYANSTEMVRSLVGEGHGCAILNMRPSISVSYSGAKLVERPIADQLPPLSLAVGYDKSRPRHLVRAFASSCQDYFQSQSGRRHVATND